MKSNINNYNYEITVDMLDQISDLRVTDGKIETYGKQYKTLINLTFTSPSAVASLISGLSENGWKFFEEIEELRKI